LIGFVLLGLGYAVLGLSNVSYFAAWFYICVDGIAWGAFAMLFIVTLWGDIAEEKNSEKYYFLGVLPYLLSNFTGLLLGPLVSGRIGESTVFSFASFFLFIAVLPLAYAPETLPEKIIKNLDINSYIRKAQEKASENKK
jgi:MFS family permease